MLQLDSLHEQEDSPVPGLTHRYRDKALFLPQLSCPVYCRFCTRSYAVGNDTPEVEKLALTASLARWEQAFAYIANQPDLEDIVISGGDSYNLKADHLQLIGERLLRMPNIRRIRYATKGLCVLPQKILSDHAWLDALTRVVELGRSLHKDVVVHTHFNHPDEITGITQDAMNRAHRARHPRALPDGAPAHRERRSGDDAAARPPAQLHQRASVLRLCARHGARRGRPAHHRSPPRRHLEKHVRGATAGFNTPAFVLDAPGGGGKRDVHSPEHYDRATGISVFTSPSVKPGKNSSTSIRIARARRRASLALDAFPPSAAR